MAICYCKGRPQGCPQEGQEGQEDSKWDLKGPRRKTRGSQTGPHGGPIGLFSVYSILVTYSKSAVS